MKPRPDTHDDDTHDDASEQRRDLSLEGGCILCGGDLDVRITPAGAASVCLACRWISHPHMKREDGAVRVVDGIGIDAARTKTMIERLAAWKAEGKVLLVLAARDETVELSSRNLRHVRVILADSLNVVDLLEADTVVFTRDALARAQEVYA